LVRAGVLLSLTECLRGFVIIHEELCSFPEIFLPISSLLHEILDKSNLPVLLCDIFHEVIDLIRKRSDEHHSSREPLQMRKKKPAPIKQLNPKFEEKYVSICILWCQYAIIFSVLEDLIVDFLGYNLSSHLSTSYLFFSVVI
jgi:hypothetical protein